VIVPGAVMGLVASLGGWLAFAVVLMALVLWRQVLTARAEDVARACHELRGPLAAARLGVEMSAARPAASVARLRAIELELDRAAVALDDLQGVSRLAVAAPEVQLVDVQPWLRDSVEAWSPVAERRGVRLSLRWEGPPARVRGRRARLAQATGNLIANAIEHGGGVVEVRVRVEPPGRARIEVIDAGPGLPAPVAELARRPHRGRGRRGRGLAIATAVAASHGGGLFAAPAPRGARLVLELPALDAGTAMVAGDPAGAPRNGPPRNAPSRNGPPGTGEHL
jgi:signal transduction histidine kinase